VRHCDEYIDDMNAPDSLRAFLAYERQPAVKKNPRRRPSLFATYVGSDPMAADCVGRRCRIVMASRFGDVGVRFTNLDRDYGYSIRCPVEHLRDFSDRMVI